MHVFVSGRLSLDLLGALKWRRDDPEELLRSPSDVREWFAAAPLGLQVSPEPRDVVGVRAVREALYRTVTAIRAAARPGRRDVTLLDDIAATAGPEMRLHGLRSDPPQRNGRAGPVGCRARRLRSPPRRWRSPDQRLREPAVHATVHRLLTRRQPTLVRHDRVRKHREGQCLPRPTTQARMISSLGRCVPAPLTAWRGFHGHEIGSS